MSNSISGSSVAYCKGGRWKLATGASAGSGNGGNCRTGTTGDGLNGSSGVVILRLPDTATASFSGPTASLSTATSGFNIYTVTAGTGTVTFSNV